MHTYYITAPEVLIDKAYTMLQILLAIQASGCHTNKMHNRTGSNAPQTLLAI
jgi:hypothetical protein